MYSSPSPVMINLGGYVRQDDGLTPMNGAEPPKGESIVYKIPPAVWIFVFLLIGYAGMRMVMED